MDNVETAGIGLTYLRTRRGKLRECQLSFRCGRLDL